jgi:predicted O-linked N-acetylglucosamine transferase (SPINDLY family)
VFWCAQSLYKYLPQYDRAFARIAAATGNCQFAFIRFPYGDYVTDIFRARLVRAFAEQGLAAEDHCVFLPRLDQQRFAAAAGLCDVVLDSIGWSGGTTTLESLAQDLPIVTLPAPLMRGRHTSAMLQLMGLPETIAASIDNYVAIAIRLGTDAAWRAEIRRQIASRKHRLYRDRACISALEAFLDGVATVS